MSDCGLDNGCQTQSILLNRKKKRVQFSLMMEVLPSNNLKISSTCQGRIKRDNGYCIQLLVAMMYGDRKWLQTSAKSLSCGRYLNHSSLVTIHTNHATATSLG